MTSAREFSFHLIDEREFRERFLPAVQGNEEIVREILEAADASGPSWTALHKVFDDTRAEWQRACELRDGEAAQRTLFAAFAQVVTHLRPAFCVERFSLVDLGERSLLERLRSPGSLLRDAGGRLLEGVPDGIDRRVGDRCLDGRSSGALIPKDELRDFLEAFRTELPALARDLPVRGVPAESGITILLSALVEAKLKGYALLEACDVLQNDQHLPKDHRRSLAEPGGLPPAVLREVARAFGKPEPEAAKPKAEPAPEPDPEPEVVPYSPQGTYAVGQRIEHKSFGQGEVIEVVDSRKIKARFGDEDKVLAHGLKPPGAGSSDSSPPLDAEPATPPSEG